MTISKFKSQAFMPSVVVLAGAIAAGAAQPVAAQTSAAPPNYRGPMNAPQVPPSYQPYQQMPQGAPIPAVDPRQRYPQTPLPPSAQPGMRYAQPGTQYGAQPTGQYGTQPGMQYGARQGIQQGVRPVEHQEPAGEAEQLAMTLAPVAGEHPLAPAMRWAKGQVTIIDKIDDYSATLVKRERIDGTLGEHEYMFVKVRHRPFSVYMYFLAPTKVKGQECLYIEGGNDGNMLAHPNGLRHKLIGTVSLSPTGSFAMAGNRHPITELGIRCLTTRLIEVGEQDLKYDECEVKTIPKAKINGRECTCLQVLHPKPRKEFLYHIARIYIDNQMNVPIRFEAYEWNPEPSGEPLLVEEYTYLNMRVNNGFTDADFDSANPNYQFK
ncbi:MAG TPA: DUF1571 domain-containing protein [Pirellulales bacterium]|nr:DUF1571 domain-containing protein [Pirellulales bacterium]